MLDYLIFTDEECIDKEEYIIATFEVEVEEGFTLEEVSRTIAFDPTIGTWTPVTHVNQEVLLNEFSGKVLLPLPRGVSTHGRIRVAIPLSVMDPTMGGIPHLLAILGAPFGLKCFRTLRLANLQFPTPFVVAHPRPRFGLSGVYQRANSQLGRPLLSTMLKPRAGLNAQAYAHMAFEVLVGGVDIIFDDELMVSPRSAPFKERVPRVKDAVLQARECTGKMKLYAVNITSSIRNLHRVALQAKALGADMLYFNPLTVGFSGLEVLATSDEVDLPVLCCRSMHGVLHRGVNGIDKYVLLKLARLAGADGMHIGSISGKLPHRVVGDEGEISARARALTSKAKYLKRIVPILSGGMHPGNIEWNIRYTGPNIIIQAGSGVIGHPDGPRAGGKAMRDVVEGLLNGQTTLEATKKSRELQHALEKWGYIYEGEVRGV